MTGPGVASVVPEAYRATQSTSSDSSSTSSQSSSPLPSQRARLQLQQLRRQQHAAIAHQVRTVLPLRLPPPRSTRVTAANEEIEPYQNEATEPPEGTTDSLEAGIISEEVVYGIPVMNDKLLSSVRQVLLLSSFMAALHVVAFMIRWIIHEDDRKMADLWPELSELAIQLTIPICGCFGAMHAHRTLLLVFCGATIIFVTVLGISCFRVLMVLSNDDAAEATICDDDHNPGLRSPCSILSENAMERIGFVIYASIYAASGLASLLAAKMLHSNLAVKSPESLGEAGRMPLVGIVVEGEVVNGLLRVSGLPHGNLLSDEAPREDVEGVAITVTSVSEPVIPGERSVAGN